MTPKYKVVAQPAVPVVTLAEAKKHLRLYVDLTEDDDYIASLIKAATDLLEARVCRSFVSRTVQATFDGFPSKEIRLLYPPGQELISVEYVDDNGQTQTLDEPDYRFAPGTPCSIFPAKSWPSASQVVVTFTAGYEDVPAIAKLIVKVLTAHWYARREPVSEKSVNEVPFLLDSLCDSLRWGDYP